MKKTPPFVVVAGLSAFGLSALLYGLHYLIYGDAHHIFIYLLGDLAFMPLEVFLVVIVIERLLSQREKRAMAHKLNMVIGVFFSEAGNELLNRLAPSFENSAGLAGQLNLTAEWTPARFRVAQRCIESARLESAMNEAELRGLGEFLKAKQTFLLQLLQNPNLLEHEAFADLLWAVTHLAEELSARSLGVLPVADVAHLNNDAARFYGRLVFQWLDYASHLQAHYPYLYSLLVRTQPFQVSPLATVE